MEQHVHANGMSGQTLTIRDLPAHERPRERLRLSGAGQLSNAELIAILLRTGIAGQSVMQLSARLLSEFDGLGRARASVVRGAERARGHGRSQGMPRAGGAGAGPSRGRPGARRPSGDPRSGRRVPSAPGTDGAPGTGAAPGCCCSTPSMKCCSCERSTREPCALRRYASRRCCVPPSARTARTSSWSTTTPPAIPPPARKTPPVTRRVRQSAELLDIELLDHVVIGARGFVSMKQRGLGFDGCGGL